MEANRTLGPGSDSPRPRLFGLHFEPPGNDEQGGGQPRSGEGRQGVEVLDLGVGEADSALALTEVGDGV